MNAIYTAVARSSGRDAMDVATAPEYRGDTVGSLVRLHRRLAGLTQEELAESAALSVRAVRNLEHDKVRRPRRSTLRRVAVALGLDTADTARLTGAARPAESTGHLGTGLIEPLVNELAARLGTEKVVAIRVCLVSVAAGRAHSARIRSATGCGRSTWT